MLTAPLLLEGIAASRGRAYGPLHVLDGRTVALRAERPSAEGRTRASHIHSGVAQVALQHAIMQALAELAQLCAATPQPDARAILESQIALLEDEALVLPAFERIFAGDDRQVAWHAAMRVQIDAYATADDEYFRARTADFCDIRDRVARALTGTALAAVPAGAIVVAEDMAPSRFVEVRWEGGGLALHGGSVTSHVAILARAQGVPMIVHMAPGDVDGHDCGLLDADSGMLVASPDAAALQRFARWEQAAAVQRARDRAYLAAPAMTATGEPVRVLLNVAHHRDLDGVSPAHCDGIGLVRTELSLTTLAALRDEHKQFEHYAHIVRWAQGRPVTFRTVDAGADKAIAGYTLPQESNAFLGVRGVRLSLRSPDILRLQFRALARAAALGPVKVMVPMVTRPFEFESVRELFDGTLEALHEAGIACGTPQLGMMVEVPAAALTLDLFPADFFSIGSNDLIAYLTATSRDSNALDALNDPLQPAVLRVIAQVVALAQRSNREVTLCGDMAGDERCLPALLAAGVRALSVAPAALPGIKAALAGLAQARA